MSQRNVDEPPPDMTISPLPRSEVPLTVFMFVQDTRVSCLVASPVVNALVSALSVLRVEKLVFIVLRDAEIASVDCMVVRVLIFLS